MDQVQPGAEHPHGVLRRDLWDSFTSAVGDVLEAKEKTSTSTSAAKSKTSASSKTVVKTVFTTDAPSTYTGPLKTKTAATTTSKSTSATTTAATKTTSSSTKKTTEATETTEAADKETGKTTTAKTTAATTDALAVDTTSSTSHTSLSVTASAATATNSASSTGGTSTAAKAGIAVGVIAGIALVFMIVFLVFRKRQKKAERQRLSDNEKVFGPFAGISTIGANNQPVPQFSSTIGTGHDAPGAGAGTQAAGAIALQNRGSNGPWERPGTAGSVNNPFGEGANRLKPAGVGAAAAGSAAGVGLMARKASIRRDGPGALDLTRNNHRLPNLSPVPPSPAGTEYSMNSLAPGQQYGPTAGGAAIAAAGGPPTSTVHRVQLDFKPTLEDELELRAGQLVRLLHEYDDGWALCIRLDRSEQGVVPRTCLSTRPVKPRPPPGGGRMGPPVNPNGGRPMTPQGRNMAPQGRPMTPQGRPMTPQGRPMTPQGGPGRMGPGGPMGGPMGGPGPMGPMSGPMGVMAPRPQSPAGRPGTPQGGRPQSPAGGRSMSPAPLNPGSRPQSPSGMDAPRNSPPGPSQLNQQVRQTNSIGRKPVPGQAY